VTTNSNDYKPEDPELAELRRLLAVLTEERNSIYAELRDIREKFQVCVAERDAALDAIHVAERFAERCIDALRAGHFAEDFPEVFAIRAARARGEEDSE